MPFEPETEPVRRRAEAALARWGLPGPLVHLRKVENHVYDAGDAILRLTSPEHRTPRLVRAEIEFIEHVAAGGASVARARPSVGGQRVEILTDGWIACCFERAPGRAMVAADRTPAVHAAWGRLLGRLHRLAPGATAGRHSWRSEPRFVGVEGLVAPEERAEYERLMDWMASLPTGPTVYGLVHGDAHMGNLHIDGDRLTIFDFDDSLVQWFAFDLAMPLFYSVASFEDRPAARASLDRMLGEIVAGVADERPIEAAEVDRVWGFLRWRRMQFHIWVRVLAAAGQDHSATGWYRRSQDRFFLDYELA